MENSDFVIESRYELITDEPDWDRARASLATGLEYEFLSEGSLAEQLGFLLEGPLRTDEDLIDKERYELQAGELLASDIDACAEIWKNPEEAGEIDGLKCAERSGDTLIVRGRPWLSHARRDEYFDPYWRFFRISAQTYTDEAGFRDGPQGVMIDLADL